MEYAIFFLTNCWVITVFIAQIVHHSFLVCFTSFINWLKLARVPLPQDKFFSSFFLLFFSLLTLSPINLSPQKHLGQLICHLDNSCVVPTVKSGAHFLRHGRCAIRKVLSPFLPSRQILWQGPLLLLEVDSVGSGI